MTFVLMVVFLILWCTNGVLAFYFGASLDFQSYHRNFWLALIGGPVLWLILAIVWFTAHVLEYLQRWDANGKK